MINNLGPHEKIDFEFDWNAIDFNQIPKSVVDVATRLVDMGLIKVQETLNEKGGVVIKTLWVCHNYFFVDGISENLVDSESSFKFTVYDRNKLNSVCNKKDDQKRCKHSACPIIVAGYIYYTRYKNESISRESTVRSEEEVYKEKISKIRKISKNESMEKILLPLVTETCTSFHCCFEGEKGLGKLESCIEISNFLFETGKIKNKRPLFLSFDEFCGMVLEKNYIPAYEFIIINDLNNLIFQGGDTDFTEETNRKNKLRMEVLEKLMKVGNNHYIVLFGDKHTLNIFLATYPKLMYLFKERIIFKEFTDNEMFDKFSSMVNKKFKSQLPEFKNIFVEYIKENRRYLPFKNKELIQFLANKVNVSGELRLPETLNSKESLESQLSSFIGMEKLKEEIRILKNYLVYRRFVEDNTNNSLPDFNLNMMFLGNPGTGKTTFARLITDLLFDLGYIKTNKLIEVERKDLFAAFAGQSAIKTDRVIKKALGGVLFIDEAYSLAAGEYYSSEVIATLVKALEDYKGELIVIFAGYEKEMQRFINCNSGIASRIGYTFNFPDYSNDELYNIYELKMKKYGFQINENAVDLVKKNIRFFSGVKNFGNGRFIDKLIQETILKHVKGLKELNVDNAMIILDEDIPEIKEMVAISLLNEDSIILPNDITEEEKKIVAYHEIGHALVSYINEKQVYIKEITIIPEGTGKLGYVAYKNKEKKSIRTKKDYSNMLMSLLGGMCSEEIIFGTFCDGSHNDFRKLTLIANDMVARLGMSEELGPMNINSNSEIGEYMKEKISVEVHNIIKENYNKTKDILVQNKDALEYLANYILEKGTLTGEEFEKVIMEYYSKKENNKLLNDKPDDLNLDENSESLLEKNEEDEKIKI